MGIDINDIRNYKSCQKKLYEIYVCMPPKNTVVINKLEQADVVKMLNGKTYFTVDDLERMQKNGDGRFNIISQAVNSGKAYLVSDKTPFVLCGTIGEMWTIGADKLAQTYTFLQSNQPYPINQQSLNQRMKGDYLDWTLVRTSQQAIRGQNMACFVPIAQKGQIQTSWGAVLNINGAGVSHGKGDFIVCSKLPNGQPNLADRWVVNGEIFATTYNNQGWADCLKHLGIKNFTIDMLPNLVNIKSVVQENSKAYKATEDAMASLGFKESWSKLNTIPQFKSHPERFYAVLQILNRYKNQHKDINWDLDDYRFIYEIDEDEPIFNIQLSAKSGTMFIVVLEYRYNVNKYYFYGWYGTTNIDPCERYLSGTSLDALYSSFCKAVNDMKDFNRHGKSYYEGLSQVDKQREINDPNSPYYCGKVDV